MRVLSRKLRLTATDLSNHLACRHLTSLDLQVAHGTRPAPPILAPDLKVTQELGLRHERNYLSYLENDKKLAVVNLENIHDERELLEQTRRLMAQGGDAIAQGALGDGEWFGRPDVLLRLGKPSGKWLWSYEVVDTKLTRDTKAGSILQLSLYSELLAKLQGSDPEFLWVVTPGNFTGEPYRVAEYAAYYRYVKSRLASVVKNGDAHTYPEPVEHCNICRWFKECDQRRRSDDHLSLVACIRRLQRRQLEVWNTETVAKLAVLPIPLKERPDHGSRGSIERVREQARVQVEGRIKNQLLYEPLPVEESIGLARLPEPSPGDLFLDLEGDRFVGEHGLQYLFGFATRNSEGHLVYEKHWALNREQEKKAFEWMVDEIMRRRASDPSLHVYHFGAYEPSTLKSLMGLHATREDEIDRLLRAEAFVDLHRVFRQGILAGVEEYSLKKLEAFPAFVRQVALEDSRRAMRFIEHRLELERSLDDLPEDVRAFMEGYNGDDCLATAALRDWLESCRSELVAGGEKITRPAPQDEAPSAELDERQKRVATLVAQLTDGIPADSAERSGEQRALWLLAQLQDWHRRENKATWWEGFRLADLNDDELLEDRSGLGGLRFIKRLKVENKIPVDRYAFEKQETEARVERDVYRDAERFGEVVAVDVANRTVDIKKTRKTAESHPPALYLWDRPFEVKEHAESLYRIGAWVAANGIDVQGKHRAARDLLLRLSPRLTAGETLTPLPLEEPKATACRIAVALDHTVFAIQGPPGAGKTYTGARMICELVKRGKKIGITALSHKVIRKLLEEVVAAAQQEKVPQVRCIQKTKEEPPTPEIAVVTGNDEAFYALHSGAANVLGGTSWLWTPEASSEAVDVLFIDEAGQMALADVIAVSQAAKSIVLIGDPQQLERPLKGSHPDGAEKSALEHLLDGHKTIPAAKGLLLPETWRLHPYICRFTSTHFYEGRLKSRPVLEKYLLQGHPHLDGAGLWFVPVGHEGNQNSSPEEVKVISKIVASLLRPCVIWQRGNEGTRPLRPEDDILIVAPYNAQVADLSEQLPSLRVGTVDKFQGQEAPVVIYSLTTSSPEDAPRGMEFLYSLNRLNVATSRAMTTVIVVGSPKLFEPECRTPRQMQLANALCGFREMATEIKSDAI
jgi:predicted RecB family nuclease